MTRAPDVLPASEAGGRVTSGNSVRSNGVGRRPRRALRPLVATAALVGVVLAACAPNQAASRPAANAGAAPKTGAMAGAATGVQVGQTAPAFNLTMLDGKPLSSADLQTQEKPYVLYFFATW